MRPPITTHVLDTATGLPAPGISVFLEFLGPDEHWIEKGHGVTDADGRLATLLPPASSVAVGLYRLTFGVEEYFREQDRASFYDDIPIAFRVDDPVAHYHVPLLLSPFGYSTYRGS